jgi:hypothetical protein
MCTNDSLSNWKELYIAALLEIDREQVHAKIHAAKMAICDRVEELNGGGSIAERTALGRALKALSELQEVYVTELPRFPRLAVRTFSSRHTKVA